MAIQSAAVPSDSKETSKVIGCFGSDFTAVLDMTLTSTNLPSVNDVNAGDLDLGSPGTSKVSGKDALQRRTRVEEQGETSEKDSFRWVLLPIGQHHIEIPRQQVTAVPLPADNSKQSLCDTPTVSASENPVRQETRSITGLGATCTSTLAATGASAPFSIRATPISVSKHDVTTRGLGDDDNHFANIFPLIDSTHGPNQGPAGNKIESSEVAAELVSSDLKGTESVSTTPTALAEMQGLPVFVLRSNKNGMNANNTTLHRPSNPGTEASQTVEDTRSHEQPTVAGATDSDLVNLRTSVYRGPVSQGKSPADSDPIPSSAEIAGAQTQTIGKMGAQSEAAQLSASSDNNPAFALAKQVQTHKSNKGSLLRDPDAALNSGEEMPPPVRSDTAPNSSAVSGADVPLSTHHTADAQPAEYPSPVTSESAPPITHLREAHLSIPQQIEMRIGLHTPSFGNVQLHAVMRSSQVGVSVESERGDLRSMLVHEAPHIAGRLEQAVKLENVRSLDNGMSFGSGTDSGGARSKWSQPQRSGFGASYRSREPTAETDREAVTGPTSSLNVSA